MFFQVPESAKLNYGKNKQTGEKHKYPLVSVNNVYVFPGIPKLMERAFNMLEVSTGHRLTVRRSKVRGQAIVSHESLLTVVGTQN